MTTLTGSSFYDTASFALPPKVAKLDAVRKLISRLMEVTGLGETAATTIAHSVVDPAAVRAALAEPLPGLTALPASHLQVIPARVWTPWVTPPADDILRYLSQKRFPVGDPSVPKTPMLAETREGLTLDWASAADRSWHLEDNAHLYNRDIYRDSLRIFPEHGGILAPLVLAPQTETFQDGSKPLHLLRIADGRYRYYGVWDLLKRYAELDQAGLDAHFGPDAITPETFRAALERDRSALSKLVDVLRDTCIQVGYEGEGQQYIGVHHVASIISLPAFIAIGTVDPATSEIRPMGTDTGYPTGTWYALNFAIASWHNDSPARIVVTGQREFDGLLLPEASVDEELIDVAAKRLRLRGVPKEIVSFGTDPAEGKAAARFVWWTRAIKQLGGTPAAAVAAFARHADGTLPQTASRPLLAAAAHMMEEDIDVVLPPGDYRDAEVRPDSLSLLVADARNLLPVAGLTDQGQGKLLAHPRWRNAVHIALAHLALIGALPAQEPLPEHVVDNPHLLSQVATAWATGQTAVFVGPDGKPYRDSEGRVMPIDERTLARDDLPKKLWAKIQYLTPPATPHPYDASHVFTLRHGVVYTLPTTPLEDMEVEATPDSIAAVVRRWFPGATGVTLTDWSDKLVTGVMVGSVWVRLYDRRGDHEDARRRGVWYPEGRPAGTKDVLDFDKVESGAPIGMLLGATDFNGYTTEGFEQADEAMLGELDSDIIQEIDDTLEAQKATDTKKGAKPSERWDVPVLRLPEGGKGRK